MRLGLTVKASSTLLPGAQTLTLSALTDTHDGRSTSSVPTVQLPNADPFESLRRLPGGTKAPSPASATASANLIYKGL